MLLVVYVLVFWLWGRWDLSSLTRNRTCSPYIRRQEILTTGLLKPQVNQFLNEEMQRSCLSPYTWRINNFLNGKCALFDKYLCTRFTKICQNVLESAKKFQAQGREWGDSTASWALNSGGTVKWNGPANQGLWLWSQATLHSMVPSSSLFIFTSLWVVFNFWQKFSMTMYVQLIPRLGIHLITLSFPCQVYYLPTRTLLLLMKIISNWFRKSKGAWNELKQLKLMKMGHVVNREAVK